MPVKSAVQPRRGEYRISQGNLTTNNSERYRRRPQLRTRQSKQVLAPAARLRAIATSSLFIGPAELTVPSCSSEQFKKAKLVTSSSASLTVLKPADVSLLLHCPPTTHGPGFAE
ncbi:hypothetical protein AMECASPLE_011917 [Ameca splendens]|uniref:Uncharacterized protein n=1 Tax=Ameca splendens TaxID=208324 RepID=A0ABV0ZB15_9TELE